MRISVICAAIALFSLQPCTAAELESATVAGWQVGAQSDDKTGRFSHCATTVTYGDTALLFRIGRDFVWSMALANFSWTLTPGQQFTLHYSIDDGPRLAVRASATTSHLLEIELTNSASVFQSFRRGQTLRVEAGGKHLAFTLTNSSHALTAVLDCAKRWVASAGVPKNSATRGIEHLRNTWRTHTNSSSLPQRGWDLRLQISPVRAGRRGAGMGVHRSHACIPGDHPARSSDAHGASSSADNSARYHRLQRPILQWLHATQISSRLRAKKTLYGVLRSGKELHLHLHRRTVAIRRRSVLWIKR